MLLLSSCTTTVKNHWNDFTAYYNTYYNAKRSFQTGIEKIEEQSVSINPEQPVRIHPAPVSAGQQDFQKAIEKGAKILRKHPETKWVDNALLLIGKSYFYTQEYFSAEQKFRELYANASSPEMKQKAVYWRGRILLEMELYSQGINYLQNELENITDWNPEFRAESQSVAAELYSNLQQWEPANQYLLDAIPELRDTKHKARAYFLHGQVLEKLDRLEEAFGAYRQVPDLHPAYDLIYHARRKQAEVSREDGKLERAYRIFVEMSKDDKNFDILPELKYEIARTLQAMGDMREAIRIYNRVLHNEKYQPTSQTRAKSYYGLANLYRNHIRDFRMAATYYDSAASVNVDRETMPADYNADQLSESFGQYASLKDEIHTADSLMWLGGLSDAKFDSVLAEIKERRKKKLEQMQKDRRSQANTSVAQSQGYNNKPDKSQTVNASSGFLNYQNRQLVIESRRSFQSYWGNRPLVDHWRRQEMVRQIRESSDTSITSEQQQEMAGKQGLQELNINLEAIPFTEEARRQKKREMIKSRYELANTFFLSLNLADSARHYYSMILEQAPDTASIVPQTLYSMSELNYIENDSTAARKLADRLIREYPETEYARRMADRYGLSQPVRRSKPAAGASDSSLVTYQTLNDSLEKLYSRTRARAYRNFAREYRETRAAAYALYKSAEQYLQVARLTVDDGRRYRSDELENLFVFSVSPDKALASLDNSNVAVGRSNAPCSGMYWDSVRTVVSHIHRNYSDLTVNTRLNATAERDSLYSCNDIQLQANMSAELREYVEKLDRSTVEKANLDPAGEAFVTLRDQLFRTLTGWKAEKQREFALSRTTSTMAPFAFFEAAKLYMQLGRQDSVYRERADKWFEEQRRMEEERRRLQQQRDSLNTALKGQSDQQNQTTPSARPSEEGPPENNDRPPNQNQPPQPSPDNNTPPNRDRPNNNSPDNNNPQPRNNAADNNTANQDTTGEEMSDKKRKKLENRLQTLRDSTIREPDYEEVFPYTGRYWDSTRTVLDQFTANFQGEVLKDEVNRLQQELAIPQSLLEEKQDTAATDRADSLKKALPDSVRQKMAADSLSKPQADSAALAARGDSTALLESGERVPPDSAAAARKDTSAAEVPGKTPPDSLVEQDSPQQNVATCKELDVTPNVVGGMAAFTDKIVYPEKVRNMSMDGQATFNVLFDKGGRVKEVEEETHGTLGIQDSIKSAIHDHMTITPVTRDQEPIEIRCKVTIPVRIEPSTENDTANQPPNAGQGQDRDN